MTAASPATDAPKTPHRYLLLMAVLGLLLTGTILHLANLADHSTFFSPPRDFLNFWAAPRLPLADLATLFDAERYMAFLAQQTDLPLYPHNWSYPLYSLWLFAPFSWLPYPLAFALWNLLGLALFLLSLRAALPRGTAWPIYLAAALSPACLINLYSGQNGLFLAAFGLFAITQLQKRPALAGLLISLWSMKPHLAPLWPVLCLARRRWRTALVAALAFGILAGLSLWFHGIAAWQSYFHTTAELQWAMLPQASADRIYAYQIMMVGLLPALCLLGVALPLALAAQLACALLVAIATYRYLRRTDTLATTALLLGCGAALLTPYCYNYDLTLMTLGLLLLWHRTPPTTLLQRWGYGLCYLLPGLSYLTNAALMPVTPFMLLLLFFHTGKTGIAPVAHPR